MIALQKLRPEVNGLGIREQEIPSPMNGEILIKLEAAGICGSDVQIYKWAKRYHKRMQLPRTIGHEMSGVVVNLGDSVRNIKVGDRVSLDSHLPCNHCYQCLTGRAHVCPNTKYPGIDFNGAFAEYICVPAALAWVNPPEVPAHLTAVLEPLGIAVHATLESTGVAGYNVVINGCGPIGLMNIAVARHFGARRVIGIDPNPYRRKLAEQMGADQVIDPCLQNVRKRVYDTTNGVGADVVFEYTGNAEGIRNCFDAVTVLGEVRWCATPSESMEFDFTVWREKRATIHNIHGRKLWQTWVQAGPLIYDKLIDIRPVLTHTLPLSEGIRAFELILEGNAGKPILVPDNSV